MYKGKLTLPVLAVMTLSISPVQAESTLKLEQAYEFVLTQNLEVQAYKARVEAAEGNRLQQSLRPNPQATFEVENFGGDNVRNGVDGAEYTLGIEQQWEIAGKRTKREEVAELEKRQLTFEALAGIQATLAKTKAAYMRVAIAQERLKLSEKRVVLANNTHKTVKKRISSAKAADIQHTKADIEISSAKVEKRRAKKTLIIAQTTLANLMNVVVMDKDIVIDLGALPELPDREVIIGAIEQLPMSVMGQLSVMREKSALDLARANGIADPTLGLGVRRFAEDDGTAFIASISIPISIFDRNQGRVAQAQAHLKEATANKELQRLNLTKQVSEMWQVLVSSREEVLDYQKSLLPSAQKAYVQAESGFNRGAFSFLDLLDAQRTLFDVQESYLEALATFYETKAQIDMISGEYETVTRSLFAQNSK
jgi:cobalt-zinc-cadmium efflux system outer membrane protein